MDVLDVLYPLGQRARPAREVVLDADLGVGPLSANGDGGTSQPFGLTSGGIWVARVGVLQADSLGEISRAARDDSDSYYPAEFVAGRIGHQGPVARLRNLRAQPEREGHGARLLTRLLKRFPSGTVVLAVAEPLDKTLKNESPELKAAVDRLKRFYRTCGFHPFEPLMFVYRVT